MGFSRRRGVGDGRRCRGAGGHYRLATSTRGGGRRGARPGLACARLRSLPRWPDVAVAPARHAGGRRIGSRERGTALGRGTCVRHDPSRALSGAHRTLPVHVAGLRAPTRSGPPRAGRRGGRPPPAPLVPRGCGDLHRGGLARLRPRASGAGRPRHAADRRHPQPVCRRTAGRLGTGVSPGRHRHRRSPRATGPGRARGDCAPCGRRCRLRPGVSRDDGRHARPGLGPCLAGVPLVHAPARIMGERHRRLAADDRVGGTGVRRSTRTPGTAARPLGGRGADAPARASRRARAHRRAPRRR